MLETILDLLFPRRCGGCGRTGHTWCPNCEIRLRRLRSRCPLCGGPSARCPLCAQQPLPLKVRSYAYYEGPVGKAIVRLKYKPDRSLGRAMASWLAEVYRAASWNAGLVVPVPLSDGRKKARGYNQVSLISDALGMALGIPHSESALARVRETPSQVGLEPHQREHNVAGAFCASKEEVVGKRVLLVDDLFTTGATLTACAEALGTAGAEETLGLTVARARSG